MTGIEPPDWTVESLTDGPRGSRTALVRLAGGRHVKVVVPPARVDAAGMLDAIETAIARLPRLPGPNT